MKVRQVSAEQLRRRLSELLNEVSYGGVQVVVERYGKPIAVLSSYPTQLSDTEVMGEVFAPVEQEPRLAREIEKVVKESGIDYQSFAAGLYAERLMTLRQKYPGFFSSHVADEAV